MIDPEGNYSVSQKCLTPQERQCLSKQDSRLVTEHTAKMLEFNAKKNWDLFYKRNETRFFKDRHWTTREFQELLNLEGNLNQTLFEIGCGVACDLSPRAIELVKTNPKYDANIIKVFQCDITTEAIFENVDLESIDIITLIFVLSAVHPDKFALTLNSIYKLLKPGGILLFRDYGLYDMAQLRFKPGHKISDNFYMRQDGTRSYYFSIEFLEKLFQECGYEIVSNVYVNKRTINIKEGIDVPRIFVQSKVRKPVNK